MQDSRSKDFKFAPSMFVTLDFGSEILLLRAIFHGFGAQTNHKSTKENPSTLK